MVGHTIFGACEAAPVAWGGQAWGLDWEWGKGRDGEESAGTSWSPSSRPFLRAVFYFI